MQYNLTKVDITIKTLQCHILLAGYEDVPSFLNQWKLIERPYIIKINMFY